jgi:hypothetical protein
MLAAHERGAGAKLPPGAALPPLDESAPDD